MNKYVLHWRETEHYFAVIEAESLQAAMDFAPNLSDLHKVDSLCELDGMVTQEEPELYKEHEKFPVYKLERKQ